MSQSTFPFLEIIPSGRDLVNVASVPKRSPFRYPGGKTWLVPRVRQWLSTQRHKPSLLVEPFAGGAIVGLTAAFERLVDQVILIELDEQVASVWRSILSDEAEELADRIATFRLTAETVKEVLSSQCNTDLDEAFRTIVRNRVNRGGILAPGAGVVKAGENGKGLASRWYPATLARRIVEIAALSDRISFVEGDGLEFMRRHMTHTDWAFFIDPPYTAAGKKAGERLYKHYQLDHGELFRVASALAGDFLMTYDNTPEIRALAQFYGLDALEVVMKNTHHNVMTELLVGRDLAWARV